ncbi:MAG TPA: hypothetical protein PKE45_07950 [Caldilineaceae bacterium]|nr:hypothetical protein [Caldilineaceae bacterium]
MGRTDHKWIDVVTVVLCVAFALYLYVSYIEPKLQPDLPCEDLQGEQYYACMEDPEHWDVDHTLHNHPQSQQRYSYHPHL